MPQLIRDDGPKAMAFAMSLTRNADAARDLLQEGYCRVARSRVRYDNERPLFPWFRRTLWHLFLDSRKRREFRRCVSLDAPVFEDGCAYGDLIADRGEGIPEQLERKETVGEVRAALGNLRPNHRTILALSDMDGRTYEDIARILSIPLGTVRSRIYRARRAFKRSFSALGAGAVYV